MARNTPSSLVPIAPVDLASTRHIQQTAERNLADNDHYLWGNYGGTIALMHFRAEDSSPYVVADPSAEEIHAIFRRTMLPGFTKWRVSVLVQNTSGSHTGTIKARMQSDPSVLVASAVVAVSQPAWTEITLDVPVDSTEARDTLEILAQAGASGALRIHAVMVRPLALTAIPAGADASGWVPHDTLEVAADLPLSVETRYKQLKNADIIRTQRPDTILNWSENVLRSGASIYQTTSSDYALQIWVTYQSHPGQTSIEWSLAGYHAAGGTGTVRLTSDRMSHEGTTGVAQGLQATWSDSSSPPFTAAQHNDGGAKLSCYENHRGWVRVELKGDGTNKAYLMALALWFADAV